MLDNRIPDGPEDGVLIPEDHSGPVPQAAHDDMPTQVRNRWEMILHAQSDCPSTKLLPVDTSLPDAGR